jgi:uncharacterized protein involved in cysteine biosynthesis
MEFKKCKILRKSEDIFMSSSTHFVRGLFVPFRGFYIVITSLKLLALAFVPFLLAIVTGIYLLVSLWSSSTSFMSILLEWVPWLHQLMQFRVADMSLLGVLFQGLFWMFVILFTIYFSYLVLIIMGAPFYSLLVDKILIRRGLQPPVQNNFIRWLYTTLKMLIITLLKLVIFMTATALLFVMSFWSLGVILVPLLVGFMIAYDCIDFSLECMNYSLRKRWSYFKGHMSFFQVWRWQFYFSVFFQACLQFVYLFLLLVGLMHLPPSPNWRLQYERKNPPSYFTKHELSL